LAPSGKPMTVHTLTPLPLSSCAHKGIQHGLTQTLWKHSRDCVAVYPTVVVTCAQGDDCTQRLSYEPVYGLPGSWNVAISLI
jgi:hypothetical protein